MKRNPTILPNTPLKLCVVLPAYNESDMITGCLESLFAQSRQPDQVIIVDNNCTDDTVAQALKFPVTVIKEFAQGIYPAAASGYDAGSVNGNEIIVRSDVDARFPDDWLAKIEASFINSPDQIAITGPGKFYDGSSVENILCNWFYMTLYFVLAGSAIGQKPLFGSNFALKSSVWQIVRSEVHHDHHLIHDDMDLTFHLLGKGTINYSKNTYTYVSIRPLRSFSGMILRTRRGFHSIYLHWPKQAPWRIYQQKIIATVSVLIRLN